MSDLRRVECWSDLSCDNGQRRAMPEHILSLTETVSLEGEHTVNLSLPFDDASVLTEDTPDGQHNYQTNRVIRLVYDVGFTEHRIASHTMTRGTGGRIRAVVARSVLMDLGFRGLVGSADAFGHRSYTFERLSLTPRQHIEAIVIPALIEAGQDFWVTGGIASDAPIDITYDRETPLSALRKIAIAAGNLELEAPNDGGLHYVINLRSQIGVGAETIRLFPGSNLASLGLTEDAGDQATRVYAFGTAQDDERATMGDARWGIANDRQPGPEDPALSLWLHLIDPAGGAGPIAVDGQYVGAVLVSPFAATRFDILGSLAASQEVLIAVSTPLGFGIGDPSTYVVIRTTGFPGAEIPYVEHPEQVAESGVRVAHLDRSDIPITANLMPNPFVRVWPGSATVVPTGWSNLGLTSVKRQTDPRFWVSAGQSCEIHTTVALPNGILGSNQAYLPPGLVGFLSFKVRLYAIGGVLRVKLIINPGAGGTLPPSAVGGLFIVPDHSIVTLENSTTGPMPPIKTTAVGLWQEIGVAACYDLNAYPLGAGFASIQIFGDPATPGADGYVDAIQLTNSAEQLPWIEGSGPTRLQQAANERLLAYATPSVALTLDAIELRDAQGDPLPYTTPVLGGAVRVTDADSGIDITTRCLGWSRDWNQRLLRSLQISHDRKDIVMRAITRRAVTPRHAA